jgi:hydrogenase 3 maturation protease
MTDTLEKEINDWFSDATKVVVAGIGNPIRSDDYVGMKIVENLKNQTSNNVLLIECETVPESYLLEIEQFTPSHILLVDAAFLGCKPGESRLVEAQKLSNETTISSHVLPLRIFCEYIKQVTDAKIALLLVEPKTIAFGEGLSQEVSFTSEKLTNILLLLLK